MSNLVLPYSNRFVLKHQLTTVLALVQADFILCKPFSSFHSSSCSLPGPMGA